MSEVQFIPHHIRHRQPDSIHPRSSGNKAGAPDTRLYFRSCRADSTEAIRDNNSTIKQLIDCFIKSRQTRLIYHHCHYRHNNQFVRLFSGYKLSPLPVFRRHTTLILCFKEKQNRTRDGRRETLHNSWEGCSLMAVMDTSETTSDTFRRAEEIYVQYLALKSVRGE